MRGSSIIGPRVKISVVRIVVKGSIIINLVSEKFSKGAAGHIFNNLIQRRNRKVPKFRSFRKNIMALDSNIMEMTEELNERNVMLRFKQGE